MLALLLIDAKICIASLLHVAALPACFSVHVMCCFVTICAAHQHQLWTQVVFQYQGIKKVKLGQHYRVPDDEDSWNDGERKAEDAAHWDSGVYSRLFLESSGAQLWESWNR